MHYCIELYGYTWDDFFYVISGKGGIILVYNGCLDHEGAVQIKEILFVGYFENFGDLYNSDIFRKMRSEVGKNAMLFFSYTQVPDNDCSIIRDVLIQNLKPRFNSMPISSTNIELRCKGACALFPKHLLAG